MLATVKVGRFVLVVRMLNLSVEYFLGVAHDHLIQDDLGPIDPSQPHVVSRHIRNGPHLVLEERLGAVGLHFELLLFAALDQLLAMAFYAYLERSHLLISRNRVG